jgi:hypothetical protein
MQLFTSVCRKQHMAEDAIMQQHPHRMRR